MTRRLQTETGSMSEENTGEEANGHGVFREERQRECDLISVCVSTMLKCETGSESRSVQDAAEQAALAIHKEPLSYSDIERGRVLAGITKLAFSTYEEAIALDNACRVSGLSRTLGAVIYSLSALYGPEDNLYLIYEALFRIDREIAAIVIGKIAGQDPSEHVRLLALQWLAYGLPSQAARLVEELIRVGAYTAAMEERYRRSVVQGPVEASGPRSVLTPAAVRTAMRILACFEQIISDPSPESRVSAVHLLADEQPVYAIPMLTLARRFLMRRYARRHLWCWLGGIRKHPVSSAALARRLSAGTTLFTSVCWPCTRTPKGRSDSRIAGGL